MSRPQTSLSEFITAEQNDSEREEVENEAPDWAERDALIRMDDDLYVVCRVYTAEGRVDEVKLVQYDEEVCYTLRQYCGQWYFMKGKSGLIDDPEQETPAPPVARIGESSDAWAWAFAVFVDESHWPSAAGDGETRLDKPDLTDDERCMSA